MLRTILRVRFGHEGSAAALLASASFDENANNIFIFLSLVDVTTELIQ